MPGDRKPQGMAAKRGAATKTTAKKATKKAAKKR
jgi:hypothetical protein